jgi:hypothetical protein
MEKMLYCFLLYRNEEITTDLEISLIADFIDYPLDWVLKKLLKE